MNRAALVTITMPQRDLDRILSHAQLNIEYEQDNGGDMAKDWSILDSFAVAIKHGSVDQPQPQGGAFPPIEESDTDW